MMGVRGIYTLKSVKEGDFCGLLYLTYSGTS